MKSEDKMLHRKPIENSKYILEEKHRKILHVSTDKGIIHLEIIAHQNTKLPELSFKKKESILQYLLK